MLDVRAQCSEGFHTLGITAGSFGGLLLDVLATPLLSTSCTCTLCCIPTIVKRLSFIVLVFQGDEEESEDDADYAPDAPGGSDAESSSDSDEDDGDEDSDDGERKKSKKRPASGSAKKGASKKQVGYLCSSYIPLVCSGPVQYTPHGECSCYVMCSPVPSHVTFAAGVLRYARTLTRSFDAVRG